jgi:hypothetical protein
MYSFREKSQRKTKRTLERYISAFRRTRPINIENTGQKVLVYNILNELGFKQNS